MVPRCGDRRSLPLISARGPRQPALYRRIYGHLFLLAGGWAFFRRARRPGIELPTPVEEEVPTPVEEVDEAVLWAAMDALSERQRRLISLYYFEGVPLDQIAKEFGLSESRVSLIHTKAIDMLRMELRERGAI
jgi:DNA-directed RNA polymerase specialized sigma24 family protein